MPAVEVLTYRIIQLTLSQEYTFDFAVVMFGVSLCIALRLWHANSILQRSDYFERKR